MKKWISFLLSFALLMSLAGCGPRNTAIKSRKLTRSEEDEIFLTPLKREEGLYGAFDFKTDARNLRIRLYSLDGHHWEEIYSSIHPLPKKKGSFLYQTAALPNGFFSLLTFDKKDYTAHSFQNPDPTLGFWERKDRAVLSPYEDGFREKLPHEQEFLLNMTVFNTPGVSPSYEYFLHPAELSQCGAEHAYALTATFTNEIFREETSAPPALSVMD